MQTVINPDPSGEVSHNMRNRIPGPTYGKLAVAQIGARMHYAIPRILAAENRLSLLFTDLYGGKFPFSALRAIPPCIRSQGIERLLRRKAKNLSPRLVRHYPSIGLKYAAQRRRTQDAAALDLWVARTFCEWVVTRYKSEIGEGIYAFNSAALEIFSSLKGTDSVKMLEQTIAPKEVEISLLHAEGEKFPEFAPTATGISPSVNQYIQRERAEWRAADVIVCGSDFVRQSICKVGGPGEKCVVIPYGVDLPKDAVARQPIQRKLRVLTVGTVGLRKGCQYVYQAAKAFGTTAEFRMVGPVQLPPAADQKLRTCVQLTGAVPRSSIQSHYDWADVFLLPSVCEGSATVTYEAMVRGIPVICTENTGSQVRHGVTGLIIENLSSDAVINEVRRCITDPNWIRFASENCLRSANTLSLATYSDRILEACNGATVKKQ